MQNDYISIYNLLAACGVSFVSTFLIIIYCFIKRNSLSSFPFQLVFMLCVSDFFFSSTNFLRSIWMLLDNNAYVNDNLCKIQGIYVQTWTMSSFLCTSTLQYSIYKRIVKNEPYPKKSAFKQYWMINYLVPLMSGIILFACGSIGRSPPFETTFCFINAGDPFKTLIMMTIFYFIPYISILLYNFIVIGLVINTIKKKREDQVNLSIKEYYKLFLYPIILFFCYFPVVFTRILRYFDIQNNQVLSIVFCIDNLIGFFNSLAYFLFSLNPCLNQNLKSQQRSEIQNNCKQKLIGYHQDYEKDYEEDENTLEIK